MRLRLCLRLHECMYMHASREALAKSLGSHLRHHATYLGRSIRPAVSSCLRSPRSPSAGKPLRTHPRNLANICRSGGIGIGMAVAGARRPLLGIVATALYGLISTIDVRATRATRSQPEIARDRYLQQLRVLQRVREHAHGVELSLPQLVVVGDQSSGKSSLLTRLTGVHFPVNSGTCTKAAIVVQCCHSETHRHDVYELRDPQDGEYHPYALDALPTAITKAQNALLATSGTKIAREEILVRATGPKQMDGQLVDLPGIIHNGDGKEETRELIEKCPDVEVRRRQAGS